MSDLPLRAEAGESQASKLDDLLVRSELCEFVFREARAADENDYAAWEALWDDEEARYWVPVDAGLDTNRFLSYINDNRQRIRSRVAQLMTGNRHAQTPPSSMRRTVSNFEFDLSGRPVAVVTANFVLVEVRDVQTVWAGRYLYRIRFDPSGQLRLVEKQVHLVNGSGPLPTLAFII
jgi:3-phenylpropionate/cinnamic acid dioxygenase small subunit